MAYSLKRAIRDWSDELYLARLWKEKGRTEVSAEVAGPGLAKGRTTVPIDEYIKMWENGLEQLRSGNVDPEHYNF